MKSKTPGLTKVSGRLIGDTWSATCPECMRVNFLDAKRSYRPLRIRLIDPGTGKHYPTFNVCEHFHQLDQPGTASDFLFKLTQRPASSQDHSHARKRSRKMQIPGLVSVPVQRTLLVFLDPKPRKTPAVRKSSSKPSKNNDHEVINCPGYAKALEDGKMISEFYYGTPWHWPVAYIPRVMLSYNMVRNLKNPWVIDKPWMLDSGAYAIILKEGKYPWKPEDYAIAIQQWRPNTAWTMDYPCEPSVRKIGNYTPIEAQRKTNQNTIEIRDKYNANVQSVVQGWTIDDYLRNLDVIRDAGLFTERLGIGSICRRGQTKQITRIIREIKRNVPGWVKLHGFGIKVDVLSTTARYVLTSADSMSWDYTARREIDLQSRSIENKLPYLLKYVNNLESLLSEPKTTLVEFDP